jgi:hypothetical protein
VKLRKVGQPCSGHGVFRRALLAGSFIAAPLASAACFDFSTAPNELLYLAFERLPFPSVVAGDTLRDSTGVVALLVASAVNGRGDVMQGAPLRYYAVGDTASALEVDSTSGRVVSAVANPQSVRIIASMGSLQTQPLSLAVTKRPDTLALLVQTDTITYSLTDTTLNFSAPLGMKVLHHDSSTFYSDVNAWVVRFTLERASDTSFASIVDDQNRRLRTEPSGLFHIDTTAADGRAARKVRVRPGAPLNLPLDSVAVLVEAKYKGAHLPGSPGRVMVYLRPRIGL